MTPAQRTIVAVAMLSQGCSVGMTIGLLPILLEPLERSFDATRTTISAGQIVIMLSLTGSSIVTGIFLDRGPVRRVMLLGVSSLVAALAIASVAQSLVGMAVAAVLAGAAVPSIGPLTAGKLVTHYFDAGRSRAMGLVSVGPPLGSGLFAGATGWLLLELEWRQVLGIYAVLAVVVLVPMIGGLVPSHFDDVPPAATPVAGAAASGAPSMGGVVREPAFLWAGAMFALVTGITTAWNVHSAAYLGGLGLGEAGRSNVLALQFWMGVPGSIAFGLLAERFGASRCLFVILIAAIGCYAGFAVAPGVAAVTVFSALVGFTVGGFIPLYLILLGQRMSPTTLGRAMGLSNLLMLPVMSAAVLLAASLFERQGAYGTTLWIFAAGLATSLLLLAGGGARGERA